MDVSLTESLAAGCIPIVAINHVVLPFFEVIDWKRFVFVFLIRFYYYFTSLFIFYRAVILWSETELNTLLDMVSGIPLDRRKEMSEQGRWLYRKYLSSPKIITMTTLKILSQRLHPHSSDFYEDWNLRPYHVC